MLLNNNYFIYRKETVKMLNLKKLMLAACGLVLTLSAAVVSASAAYDVDIVSGDKSAATKYNYIKVLVSGLADDPSATEGLTTNGSIYIKVDKGLFSAATKQSLAEEGLYFTDESDEPNWNVALNTTASDDYDVINVGWYTDTPCYTATGAIIDVRLTYADTVNLGVATMTVLPSSVITICDDEGNTVAKNTSFNANTYTYTLASGVNTVTKTEPGPSVVWETADHVANYDGEVDSSTATAYKVTLTGDGENHDTITWKATTTDGTVKGHRTTGLSIGGTGTYKFGIAIGGIKTEDGGIAKVEAALGAQGNE